MTALLPQVRATLGLALKRAGDHPVAAELAAVATRLDDPLQVAVVGRVKAGKSTLVNAMVGDLVAPTDARECTRIVTWYRDGVTYRVEGVTVDDEVVTLRHDRDHDGLQIDLGGRRVEDLASLQVEFPSAPLREMTLIDTPGLGSLDAAAGTRTVTALTGDGRAMHCDAVLHLLRHVHPDDLGFLEAFHDDGFVDSSPLNAIGVLSRADEIGAAREDALASAATIAERWRGDERLAGLVATVVPVAGLLAQGARTFRHAEFQAFQELAGTETSVLDDALVSVDRFVSEAIPVAVSGAERAGLLDRFGFYGCRRAIAHLRTVPDQGPSGLAEELLAASGLPTLRAAVAERFGRRAELLRARNGLRAAMRAAAVLGDHDLAVAVERVGANTHELAEATLLEALRRGELGFDEAAAASATRLLGDQGDRLAARAGVDEGADAGTLRAALVDEHARWQRRGAHPLASHTEAAAAAVLVRTCEGLLAALAVPPGPASPTRTDLPPEHPSDPTRSPFIEPTPSR